MSKLEREAHVAKVQRMKAIEPMLSTEGWKVYRAELERLHEYVIRSLMSEVSNHAGMAKQAGRLDALRDMLNYPDKVLREGKEAARALNGKGGSSSEEEE